MYITSHTHTHTHTPQTQFRSCMLYSFLQILLQTLVQKSHDLLQEEICSCVYSMAAVDFTTYHQEFFPKFLTGMSEGLSEAQRAELAKNYKMVEVRDALLFRGGSGLCANIVVCRDGLGPLSPSPSPPPSLPLFPSIFFSSFFLL